MTNEAEVAMQPGGLKGTGVGDPVKDLQPCRPRDQRALARERTHRA